MSTATEASGFSAEFLSSILSDETFTPAEPRSIEDTGLSITFVEALVCKYLLVVGSASGRGIAKQLCLPFGTLEGVYQSLRSRQILVHTGSAPLSDYNYTLTEQGRERAQSFLTDEHIQRIVKAYQSFKTEPGFTRVVRTYGQRKAGCAVGHVCVRYAYIAEGTMYAPPRET